MENSLDTPALTPDPKPSENRDGGGTLFDPSRHKVRPDGTPFVNRFGRYMPRGGRRRADAPAPATASSSLQGAEAGTVTAKPPGDLLSIALPLPSAPSASAPAPDLPGAQAAWSEEERAAAARAVPLLPQASADVDAGAGAGAATQGGAGAVRPEAVAELYARVTYSVVGLVSGERAEARPSAAEHRNLVEVTAAYVKAKGWETSGGWGLLVVWTAYLLGVAEKPKSLEGLKARFGRWFGRKKPEVKPNETAQDGKPEAQPMRPAAPTVEAEFSLAGGPFGGRSPFQL
jgi:hypothetical protein